MYITASFTDTWQAARSLLSLFPNVLSLQPSGFFKKRQREAGQKDKRGGGQRGKGESKVKDQLRDPGQTEKQSLVQRPSWMRLTRFQSQSPVVWPQGCWSDGEEAEPGPADFILFRVYLPSHWSSFPVWLPLPQPALQGSLPPWVVSKRIFNSPSSPQCPEGPAHQCNQFTQLATAEQPAYLTLPMDSKSPSTILTINFQATLSALSSVSQNSAPWSFIPHLLEPSFQRPS